MTEEYDELLDLCYELTGHGDSCHIAIKGMHEFAESKKDAMNMLRNFCPENFYNGVKCYCEMKALEKYPKWQQCNLCWMQVVKDIELEAT